MRRFLLRLRLVLTKFRPMSEPLPFPNEYEMAMEDFLGHPLPGNPQERLHALRRRLEYLKGAKLKCLALMEDGNDYDQATKLLTEVNADIAEAKKQIGEWQAQYQGRN
jgi:hypothetical protein